ncbi:MAG: glycosyltransferase [Pseudomonadota bacterium]
MKKHVVLVTLGTYGDILTRIALAEALLRCGARATIVTYAYFEDLVRASGADFRPVPGDPRVIIANAKQDTFQGAADGDPEAYAADLKAYIEARRERALSLIDAAFEACRDADLIVYGITSIFSVSLGEALGIPTRAALNVPFTPTDLFAAVIAPMDRYPRPAFTKASHRRANRAMGQSYTPLINAWRATRTSLPPLAPQGPLVALEKSAEPILYGCSQTIIPRDPNWPKRIDVVGAWRPRVMADEAPDNDLVRFIEAGDAPIVIGFSSAQIEEEDTARIAGALEKIIARRRERFVILSGWMSLRVASAACERVITLAEAPHDWLYPRSACVIHAAGAGSAHAQLAARVPGVIIPLWGDQFFWSRRMAAAARAVDMGHVSRVSAESLNAAIDRALALPREDWPDEPRDGADRAARLFMQAL